MYTKSPDNPDGKNLFAHLVTDGLGYCCVYFFLAQKFPTQATADRLGISDRIVRKHKAFGKDRRYVCNECDKCMKKKKPE